METVKDAQIARAKGEELETPTARPVYQPVLLILNSSTTPGGVWLAAGIPEQLRHREER